MKVKTVKRICLSIITGVVILSNAGAIMTFANNHIDTEYSAYEYISLYCRSGRRKRKYKTSSGTLS